MDSSSRCPISWPPPCVPDPTESTGGNLGSCGEMACRCEGPAVGAAFPPDMTLVAGVDDHPVALSGLSTLSSVRPGLVFVGGAASVDELLAEEASFDVVLLDLRLDNGSLPRDNVAKLVEAGKTVLVYTDADRPILIADALAAGAMGAVEKSLPLDAVAESIVAVVNGDRFISPGVADALARDVVLRPALSDRELEVLRLVGLGLADKQIARILSISEDTAKEYLRRVRAKYAERGRPATSRIELFRRSLEDGISDDPGRRFFREQG